MDKLPQLLVIVVVEVGVVVAEEGGVGGEGTGSEVFSLIASTFGRCEKRGGLSSGSAAALGERDVMVLGKPDEGTLDVIPRLLGTEASFLEDKSLNLTFLHK